MRAKLFIMVSAIVVALAGAMSIASAMRASASSTR